MRDPGLSAAGRGTVGGSPEAPPLQPPHLHLVPAVWPGAPQPPSLSTWGRTLCTRTCLCALWVAGTWGHTWVYTLTAGRSEISAVTGELPCGVRAPCLPPRLCQDSGEGGRLLESPSCGTSHGFWQRVCWPVWPLRRETWSGRKPCGVVLADHLHCVAVRRVWVPRTRVLRPRLPLRCLQRLLFCSDGSRLECVGGRCS